MRQTRGGGMKRGKKGGRVGGGLGFLLSVCRAGGDISSVHLTMLNSPLGVGLSGKFHRVN